MVLNVWEIVLSAPATATNDLPKIKNIKKSDEDDDQSGSASNFASVLNVSSA